MTINDELLRKALAANVRAAEAQAAAAAARYEYHSTIRRIHLAGASLREIGEALGISHQRVQQIVSATGGSWWQKLWRTRKLVADATCSFCGRKRDAVKQLISGSRALICEHCITAGETALTAPMTNDGSMHIAPSGSKATCSFCGKRRSAEL